MTINQQRLSASEGRFEMVAKTFQGLEEILAEELRGLGAIDVEPGRRMVSFSGTLETLYRANMCCRTALRVLKPLEKFSARTPDELYAKVKEIPWEELLTIDKTFAIDSTVYSEEFTHSRYVTYRVKDAIVDRFQDRLGAGKRPGVRLKDADVILNVHISGTDVTVSLDSSGEPLYRRGYRVAQTDAPINEVLAAAIILKSGWRGETPFVDPMCGSGTFLIEAALIAANIMPGVYRRGFAFEQWPDFDRELFDSIYQDDSAEHEVTVPIIGADISPKAIAIATKNVKSAGVSKYVTLERKALSQWIEAPADGVPGVMVTNPPYGERISVEDMEGLYSILGSKLKGVFKGYHAWVIGYRREYFDAIGLAPSLKMPVLNGALECELREYVIFEGNYSAFREAGGTIKDGPVRTDAPRRREDKPEHRDKKGGGFRKGAPGRPDFKKGGDRKPRFKDAPRQAEAESENPLAKRRNVYALNSLLNRRPKLGEIPTVMRSRRGWKRPDSGENNTPDTSTNPTDNNE